MLFWKYFGFVILLHSDQILGKESYEVHLQAVNWLQSIQNCEKLSSKLVSFNPVLMYNIRSIPSLKREIYPYSNESWVGDYISYEVVKDQQMQIREDDVCVELHVTMNASLNTTHYLYQYLLFPADCTNSHLIICEENTTDLNITNNLEPWPGSCYHRQLWMPPFEPYYVAVEGAFGNGNYTTTERLTEGKTYWTGYRLQQFRSEIPVRGNILRCGFISLREPSILYDECNANKSYACERILSDIRPNKQNTTSSSTGLYAGLGVSAIVFLVVCLLIIKWLRWRRRRINQDENKMSFQRNKHTSPIFLQEKQTHESQKCNNQTCTNTLSKQVSDKNKETYLTLPTDSTYDSIEDSSQYHEIDVSKLEEDLKKEIHTVTNSEPEHSYVGPNLDNCSKSRSENEYEPLDNMDSTHIYNVLNKED